MKPKAQILLAFVLSLGLSWFACESEQQTQRTTSTNDPAMLTLNSLIKDHSEDPYLWMQRGQLLLEDGRYQEAASDLEHALAIDSSIHAAWHALADAYLDGLRSRKALHTMEKTVQLFPDSIISYLKLSEFQLILKRYSEAMQTLTAILEIDPQNADAYFMKGMVLKESGDTTQSIRQFQMATREDPFLTDAWINLGKLLEAKHDPAALDYLNAGLAATPDHFPLMLAKAQYLARNHKIDEAKSLYRYMIKLDPDYSDAFYDLGLLYLDQDSILKAQQHFDLTIKTAPDYALAYFYMGLTYEIGDDYQQANRYYDQANRLDPDNANISEALARVQSLMAEQ